MFRVSGWRYEGGEFTPGSIAVEDGTITEVSTQKARDAIAVGLILPPFANAHTHAGDAVVGGEVRGSLEDLVAPPHGLKHRALAKASDQEVIDAMRGYFETMFCTGTIEFWDFREMGLRGLRQLFAALLGFPLHPVALGRPLEMRYNSEEVAGVLRASDGIGISSLLDWNEGAARRIAADTHRSGKWFATHVSERVREDIDAVLDLKPDVLVHATESTDADLERIREAGVPIVVCPRSSAFFGKTVDLPRMIRSGVRLFLGTDNAMVNAPSMLRELEFALKIARLRGDVDPRDLLEMAFRGRQGLGPGNDPGLRPGDPAEFIVLAVPAGTPTIGRVFRAVDTDISLVSAGARAWIREGGGLIEIPQAHEGKRRRQTSRRR